MELEETTRQINDALELMGNSVNKMSAMSDALSPLMKGQIEKLRSARMALTSEASQTLRALGDVRDFFMDHKYEAEMSRLERFIALCHEFKQLKDSGILDDVAEVAIKMSLRDGLDGRQ